MLLLVFLSARREIVNIDEFDEIISEKIVEKKQGTTYYVSSQGTSSDGTDITSPMSLSKAKTKKYGSNDRILLKCGDTFYEQVAFNIEAEDNQYCLISSYGDGEMPVIDMSKIVSNANLCETYSNGIYKIDLSNKNNFDGYVGDNYKSCNIGFFISIFPETKRCSFPIFVFIFFSPLSSWPVAVKLASCFCSKVNFVA